MNALVILLALFACGPSGEETDETDDTTISDPNAFENGVIIGPEGGRVNVGLAYIDVPAGALAEPVEIGINPAGAPSSDDAVSDLYVLQPHGLTFAIPVTVGIPITADAAVLKWSEDGTSFSAVDTLVMDGIAFTQTDSFSWVFADAGISEQVLPCTECVIESVDNWLVADLDSDFPNEADVTSNYGKNYADAEINDLGGDGAMYRSWFPVPLANGKVRFKTSNDFCLTDIQESQEEDDWDYAMALPCADVEGMEPTSTSWGDLYDEWTLTELSNGRFKLSTPNRCLVYFREGNTADVPTGMDARVMACSVLVDTTYFSDEWTINTAP